MFINFVAVSYEEAAVPTYLIRLIGLVFLVQIVNYKKT